MFTRLVEAYLSIYNEDYQPRIGDIFYHGSVNDFEPNEIKSPDGLVYLSRNVLHAFNYAMRSGGFDRNSYKEGFVYSYKIKPNAKIFDATNKNDFNKYFKKELDPIHQFGDVKFSTPFDPQFGYTELMQDKGEIKKQKSIVEKILEKGFDGVLQRQAETNQWGNLIPRTVKKRQYGQNKKYKAKLDNIDFGFKGDVILGIKPEFLDFYKKIPYGELADNHLEMHKSFKNK
jgi:hypothetical protein